jgi:3,4-dihydroxy-2-butanone 4-phosphate synthase
MALTAAQRRRLPRSAFAYAPAGTPRSRWRYPIPTRSQARRAGISEGQRRRTINSAKSYAAHRNTLGSPGQIQPVARRRRGAAPAPRRGRRAAAYRRYRGRGGRLVRGPGGWKRKAAPRRRSRR